MFNRENFGRWNILAGRKCFANKTNFKQSERNILQTSAGLYLNIPHQNTLRSVCDSVTYGNQTAQFPPLAVTDGSRTVS